MQKPTQAEIDNMLRELAKSRPRHPISFYLASAEKCAAKFNIEPWQAITVWHGMKRREAERRLREIPK